MTLKLVIPAELGDADAVIAEVRAGVAKVEAQVLEERKRSGRRIVGRSRVLNQSWRSSPSSLEPRRGLRPRFAGLKENRIVALVAFRDFLAAYRAARRRWIEGIETVFPIGTYWLARFAPVSSGFEKQN